MWRPYLDSICREYAKWWEVYTLTDVARKKSVEQPQNISPLLDLGLMVQTVESEEKRRERPEEKIERLTVLEGLRKYAPNHVLLVGRPGSGKSTALARLLLEDAEKLRSPLSPPLRRGEKEETLPFPRKTEGDTRTTPPFPRGAGGDQPKVPILIELRYSQSSVLERIQKFIYKHDPNIYIDVATLETKLRQGEFLLLFDGFNEMASEAARQQVRMFRQDYPQTAMVFTTRDLSLGGDLGIEKRLEMQPLTESQMQEFVCAYLPEHGENLWQQLQGRLRELGETPMFLLMLCSVFGYNKVIPAHLGLVFRSFTQTYSGRLKQDVPVDESSRRWWDRLLQELAWVMTNGESKTEIMVAISRQKAEAVLTEFLQGRVVAPDDCAMRWLEDLLEHHLIQVGDDGEISFRHQLLQEYYVAERLLWRLDGMSDYELQWEYLNYLKWTEVVALMLGLVEDEGVAVRVVRLAVEVDWFLGAKLVGEVQRRFEEMAFVEVERLELPGLVKVELAGLTKSDVAVARLVKFLEDSDPNVRRNAVYTLDKTGWETAIPELISLLEDSDSHVRGEAAYALGEIGSETAIPGLIQLLEDSDSDVRKSAVYALGKIGSETAVSALIPLLEDSDSHVRRSAAEALGKIGTVPEKSETAILGLIKLLEDSNVGWTAANALGKIGSETAIPGLIQLLENSDSDVRKKATDTLGEIGSEIAMPALIQLLEDSDFHVRWTAADALGKIDSKTVIPGLIQLLENSDSHVRWKAADALGKISTVPQKLETVIPGLIQLLEDSDSHVRLRAADALGKTSKVPEKSETVIPGLIQLLEDSDSHVRLRAAQALGETGSEVAILGLIQLLEDSDSHVRLEAAQALGETGSEIAIPGLIQLLEDSDSHVRLGATNALSRIGSKIAIPALIQLLEHSNSDVRGNAAYVLGKIGSETAIEKLIPLLKDSDSNVRWSAADALGETGSEIVVPELIQLLEDSDPYVRCMAADALSKIGSETAILAYETAIPGLIQLLKGLDFEEYICVSEIVSEVVDRIKSKTAIPGLIQLLENSNSDVRANAAKALGKIGSETAIPGLIQLLEDSDSFVRWMAAEALGEIGSETAIPGLIQFLEDENSDFDMRQSAAEALSKIGSETGVPGLIRLLEHSNSDVHLNALDLLIEIGSETAIPGLIQLLEHSDLDVGISAAEALSKIVTVPEKLETVIPELVQFLEDSADFDEHWMVTHFLAEIGSENTIVELTNKLKNDNFVKRTLYKTIEVIQTIQQRLQYYTRKKTMSNTLSHNYALLIGVGDCKYPNWSLPVTVKDVQTIKSFLIKPDLCGYIDDENYLRLLSNEQATKQNILDNLNWLQQQAKNDPEATILVYYSGHGWLDKSTQNYYLIPHDTSPVKLQKTALPATEFNNALQQISAQKLLVIIDSCHAQGMATAKETEELELPENFSQTALPKNLIADLRKGTGRAVFTSSTGEEQSYYHQEMSIYTQHFLEALNGANNKPGDKEVKVSNLMNYVSKTVPESAQKLGKKQTPIFDFSQTEDFPVALLRGGKGLPDGGWEEVKQETQEKIQAARDVIDIGGIDISKIDISDNSGTITITGTGDISSK